MTDAIPAHLADLSLMTVASMIAKREISPVDVTRAVIDRIEAKNPSLNAFITVLSAQAMDSARNAESEIARGGYRGPLHGVPISVKDLFWTAGVRTTAGSRVLGQYIPEENATVVERLNDAGAILVGKTTMEEFAFPCVHPDFGSALNPWDLSRTPGGSSSGSAVAVAAGMGYGSLGTDTGGSIRIPAAYCGIVGLKPTYGRVSRSGAIPASWTADHVGPMTRTVADGAAMLAVIAGVDARDHTSSRRPVPDYVANLNQAIAGLRIGITNVFDEEAIEPEVRNLFDAAVAHIRLLGASIVEIAIPSPAIAVESLLGIVPAESYVTHIAWLREHAEDYSPAVRNWLDVGASISATTYILAQQSRRRMRIEMRAAMNAVDVLMTPTTPATAPLLATHAAASSDSDPALLSLLRFVGPHNVTGFPAISIPCGFTSAGLPVGLQLMAKPFAESVLLQTAYAFEKSVTLRDIRSSTLHDSTNEA